MEVPDFWCRVQISNFLYAIQFNAFVLLLSCRMLHMQVTVDMSHDFVTRLGAHNDQAMRPAAGLSTTGQLMQDHTILESGTMQGVHSVTGQAQLASHSSINFQRAGQRRAPEYAQSCNICGMASQLPYMCMHSLLRCWSMPQLMYSCLRCVGSTPLTWMCVCVQSKA